MELEQFTVFESFFIRIYFVILALESDNVKYVVAHFSVCTVCQ